MTDDFNAAPDGDAQETRFFDPVSVKNRVMGMIGCEH